MSKEESLYDLNDDEMLENKQSGVKVTARVLKGYILNGKKNKYDGQWYLLENKKFNLFENAIKESISQLNDYSQGNDNNVEVVTYKKGKRVIEKRNTWRVDEDLYKKVKDLAKKENKSMIDFVDDICLEISEGKHDDLAKESKDRTKALAVHQSKTNLAKNHLKEIGSNVGVLTILEEIVNDKYKEMK